MKRKLIYWLIEITYLLISVVLLINLNDRYFSYHSSDIYYFICFGIIILVLLLLFEPVKNKIIIFLFDFLFFNYIITQSENLEITGEAIRISDFNLKLYFNDVSIIILLITTMIFIALWYYFQREVVNYSKYQILSITLLVFIPFLYHLNYNAILEDAKAYGYQLNETDYYDYLHFNNSNIFIEKFGISNYLVEDISQAFTIDIKREKAIKSIDKFLENKKIPIENRHSGIFKGKNVLIIQADGFIDAFVSKELTPNIYKLKSEGINITEFYSPCINEKQGNTEIMANFSIIPSYNDYGLYKYDNNEYITTLAATFNKSDYYSYYYHNDYSIYYNKDIIVPKYQFNENKFSIDFGCSGLSSHIPLAESIKWYTSWADYKNVIYYGSKIYDDVNADYINAIKEKYPNLDNSYYKYISNAIDLDKAIGIILAEQENAGTQDNNVIVFFGSNIDNATFIEESSILNNNPSIENMSNGLYIYNNGNYIEEINKPCTTIDLLPTLADLFDLDYDNRTVLGHDIFSYRYGGFIFDDSMDDDTTWVISNYDFNYFYTSFIEDSRRYYIDLMDVNHKILKYDYFKYVK